MFVGFVPNVVDALSCRSQSFRQVYYKSAVDCMRNANKCPEIPEAADPGMAMPDHAALETPS